MIHTRLHRFVNQLGDCFAEDKNVAGSTPAGATFNRVRNPTVFPIVLCLISYFLIRSR